jgi:metal-sulfur cluster biosynthetic enzyme
MKTSKLNKHVQARSSKIKNKVKEVLNELQQLYDPAIPINMQAFNEFEKLLDDPSFHSRTMQVGMSGACMVNQTY